MMRILTNLRNNEKSYFFEAIRTALRPAPFDTRLSSPSIYFVYSKIKTNNNAKGRRKNLSAISSIIPLYILFFFFVFRILIRAKNLNTFCAGYVFRPSSVVSTNSLKTYTPDVFFFIFFQVRIKNEKIEKIKKEKTIKCEDEI